LVLVFGKQCRITFVLFALFSIIFLDFCNAGSLNLKLKSFFVSNTVMINCKKCDYAERGLKYLVCYGHGFIVKCEIDVCYVLTVNHILPFDDIVVYSSDMRPLEVLQTIIDPKHNLAVIKVKAENADSFDYTDEIALPENSMNVLTSVITTSGIVVERGKILDIRKEKGMEVFEHDLYLNPGYEGSIVVNKGGQIVGINLIKLSNENGLAISASEIKKFLNLIFRRD
jgi:S1-C subfamily serine protease